MIESARKLGNLLWPCLASLLLGGCATLFFAALDKLEFAPGVVEHDHLVFDPVHRLALDAYAPRGAHDAPVVVFFYGGSWSDGKRRWYRYVGDALAAHGVVALLPDYRKFPDVRFPAFMLDAAHAVRYALDHASEFGGDPQRLFVMGHSAGGQIAALLACDARYLAAVGMRPRQLSGMIGIAGAYAFLPFVDDEAQIFGDDARGRHDSQPVNFVDGDEPPMLLLQGGADDDVTPENAQILAERAQAMDGNVRLEIYPGVGHNQIMLALARGRHGGVPTLADVLAFIDGEPAVAARAARAVPDP